MYPEQLHYSFNILHLKNIRRQRIHLRVFAYFTVITRFNLRFGKSRTEFINVQECDATKAS